METIKFSKKTKQFYTVPNDAIDVSDVVVNQARDAQSQGLPFVILDGDNITVAPSPAHKYYADLGRWIDYVYKYSPSTQSMYPIDMLDAYSDLPTDLISITTHVHEQALNALNASLQYQITDDGETITVAPSPAHDWDAKKGAWVLNKTKQAAIDAQAKATADAQAAAAAQAAKAQALASIVVTTQSGKTFDGNETARNNMQQALTASQLTGIETASWKLADNTLVEVTVAEIGEALVLSIQRVGQSVAGS